jgi:hypothetical protein
MNAARLTARVLESADQGLRKDAAWPGGEFSR